MTMEYVKLTQIMTFFTDDVTNVGFKQGRSIIATGPQSLVIYLTIGHYFPTPIKQNPERVYFQKLAYEVIFTMLLQGYIT